MAKRRGNGSGSLFKRSAGGCWIASWYDYTGQRRTRSTRTTDRAAAQRILTKYTGDTALRREGVIDPRADVLAGHGRRTLVAHLDDFEAALQARNAKPKHVRAVRKYIADIAEACEFTSITGIDAGKVSAHLNTLRAGGMSARAIDCRLAAIKSFTRWLHLSDRLHSDPLKAVRRDTKAVNADPRRKRRAMTGDELARLIDAAERGPANLGMTGTDRAMLYRVAAGTGFRASELASLTPGSFALDGDPPTVTVAAAYSKRRRDDVQPIRPGLADLLRDWLHGRKRDRPVFTVRRPAEAVRADLRRARAWWLREGKTRQERRERRQATFLREYDDAGKVVDFHALRHTYITNVVNSGASVKVAQELARHSTPTLTIGRYAHTRLHDLTRALDALPGERPDDTRQTMKATGTTDSQPAEQAADPDPARSSRRSNSSAKARDSARRGALKLAGATDDGQDENPGNSAEKRDVARPGATQNGNTPGRSRTCDLPLRRRLLYPTELRAQTTSWLMSDC